VLATVCEKLMLYVPVPPVPVPSDTIYGRNPALEIAFPGLETYWPTESAPEATAVTVSTVPEIDPVNFAGATVAPIVET
jgi:hypothetical protein